MIIDQRMSWADKVFANSIYRTDFYFMFHIQSSLLHQIIGSPQYHFYVKIGFFILDNSVLSVCPVITSRGLPVLLNSTELCWDDHLGLSQAQAEFFISVLHLHRLLVTYAVIFFRVIMALNNPKTQKRGSKLSPNFVFLIRRTGCQPQNSRGK